MKLKFLADVHISPIAVNAFKNAGYDIIRVTDKLPPTATDSI
ncbi:hypothetical protein [Thermodesulfovibrio hydrogeniphilus]